MTDIIHTDNASKPLGAYPHARRVGNLLFLSGIGPATLKTIVSRVSKPIAMVILLSMISKQNVIRYLQT